MLYIVGIYNKDFTRLKGYIADRSYAGIPDTYTKYKECASTFGSIEDAETYAKDFSEYFRVLQYKEDKK